MILIFYEMFTDFNCKLETLISMIIKFKVKALTA